MPGHAHAPSRTALDTARRPVEVGVGAPVRPLRIALAHDWLVGMRGGEMVLARIAGLVAREHRAARLYTMFANGQSHSAAIDGWNRRVSLLGRMPGALAARRWLLPLYPGAVGRLSRRLARDHAAEPVDLLISTSSAAIKGLRPPRGVPHLCYCHSPARYLWSQGEEYARASVAARIGLGVFGGGLRDWDRRASDRVDRFIANSRHTAALIERCYGRSAVVIHPPVRTGFFTPDPTVAREGFWLFVGALEPYKRVDLAIDAAKMAGVRLVVAGDGSLSGRLRARGERHVELRGRVSDEALRDLYRRAALVVFPQVEDFGIVAAEALACGTPVVARHAGGALDIVDSRTGAWFDGPTADAVVAAARACPSSVAAACRTAALRFSEERFDESMRRAIASTVET